jgi:hypothetical protein
LRDKKTVYTILTRFFGNYWLTLQRSGTPGNGAPLFRFYARST